MIARTINVIAKIRLGLIVLAVLLICPVQGLPQDGKDASSEGGQQATSEDGQSQLKQKTESKGQVDHTFDEIVVTATRSPVALSESPASVSVVTKEDIEKRNVQTVNSALNLVPGLYDKQAKPLDTTSRVVIRGVPDQKRNLVMLDGLPLNDAYTGVANWNGMLPENIERIEVARGPFSSLYGGNAMGGVVSMLTKMPEKREFNLQGGAGSDGYYTAYGSYGDKVTKNLSIFASYGYQASNGYPTNLVVKTPGTVTNTTPVTGAQPTTTTAGKEAYLIGDGGDNDWFRDSGVFKLAYDLTENSKATFSYYRNQYGYGYNNPNTYLTDSFGTAFWSGNASFNKKTFSVSEYNFLPGEGGVTQNIYNAGYQTGLFSDHLLKVSCGLVDNTSNWYTTTSSGAARAGTGPGTLNETPSQAFISDLQYSIPILEKHLLIFGGGYRYDYANTQEHNLKNWKDTDSQGALSFESGGRDNIWSIYSQGEIAILQNLKAYLGLRGDWWVSYDGMVDPLGAAGPTTNYPSRSTFNLSPKGSLVYTPFEKTTLRGSVGTAFRPPNVYELFRTWSYLGTTYRNNPVLDPETSFSWDLGVEQRIWDSAVVRVGYFSNRLKDLIYYRTISSTLKQYENAGLAETNGVELEWDHRLAKWFRYFANFTYTHSEMLENASNPASVGKQLTLVPEYMFNLGTEFTYGPASLMITGHYVSKQYSTDTNTDVVNGVYGSYDPFFVADVSFKYAVTKHAVLSFAIDNIWDTNYFVSYQAPGRKFYGSLAFKF